MLMSKKLVLFLLIFLAVSLVVVEVASAKRRYRTPTITCTCSATAPGEGSCCERQTSGLCYNVVENKYDTAHNQLRAGRCVAFKQCTLSINGGPAAGPCGEPYTNVASLDECRKKKNIAYGLCPLCAFAASMGGGGYTYKGTTC